MKKISWEKFRKALIKNSISVNPDNLEMYWKDQLHKWNCGNRGPDMHDNALSTLTEIENA
jgi:hypothetical protein